MLILWLGAITGQGQSAKIDSCWWITGVGSGNNGALTNSSIVSSEVLKGYATKLGSEYFTDDVNNINVGYPILKWQN